MKASRTFGRSEMNCFTMLPEIMREKFLLRFGDAIDYLPPTRAAWSERCALSF